MEAGVTCSINNNGFTGYARKHKMNEVQVYVTIKPKGLSQRFEESEEGDRQIRCLQHNPEKIKHRCSPENRRSNGES